MFTSSNAEDKVAPDKKNKLKSDSANINDAYDPSVESETNESPVNIKDDYEEHASINELRARFFEEPKSASSLKAEVGSESLLQKDKKIFYVENDQDHFKEQFDFNQQYQEENAAFKTISYRYPNSTNYITNTNFNPLFRSSVRSPFRGSNVDSVSNRRKSADPDKNLLVKRKYSVPTMKETLSALDLREIGDRLNLLQKGKNLLRNYESAHDIRHQSPSYSTPSARSSPQVFNFPPAKQSFSLNRSVISFDDKLTISSESNLSSQPDDEELQLDPTRRLLFETLDHIKDAVPELTPDLDLLSIDPYTIKRHFNFSDDEIKIAQQLQEFEDKEYLEPKYSSPDIRPNIDVGEYSSKNGTSEDIANNNLASAVNKQNAQNTNSTFQEALLAATNMSTNQEELSDLNRSREERRSQRNKKRLSFPIVPEESEYQGTAVSDPKR